MLLLLGGNLLERILEPGAKVRRRFGPSLLADTVYHEDGTGATRMRFAVWQGVRDALNIPEEVSLLECQGAWLGI
jgi:hypothetical protein